MITTKLFYYAPAISISSKELFDIAENWISREEWEREGLRVTYKSLKSPYMQCVLEYAKDKYINVRITELDKDTPILITGTSQRQMQKVASKLTRLLKFNLTKVNEGELVASFTCKI